MTAVGPAAVDQVDRLHATLNRPAARKQHAERLDGSIEACFVEEEAPLEDEVVFAFDEVRGRRLTGSRRGRARRRRRAGRRGRTRGGSDVSAAATGHGHADE